MNKLDFMAALTYLSDPAIEEAEAAREAPIKKRRRPWLKFTAIAACAALVLLAGFALSRSVHINRLPDNTAVPENSAEPDTEYETPLPVIVDGLPQLSMPSEDSESGGGGVFLKNGTEDLKGAEPLLPADIPEKMPVYKNPTKFYGGVYPDFTDVNKIRENLDACARAWGLDIAELTVTEENPFSEYSAAELERIFSDVYGVPVPEGVYQTQSMSAEAEGISVTANQYGATVTVKADLPEFDGEDGFAKYILENYGDKLLMSAPETNITGGGRNADGKQIFTVSFYEGEGGAAERLINKELRSVSVIREDSGLKFSYSFKEGELLGEYPTVAADEAIELLEQGFYLEAAEGDVISRENIEKIELGYVSGSSEYWFPCYKIWIYDPDGAIERVMNMKLYNVYTVPATEPRYFAESGLSTAEEAAPLAPFSAEDIPEYQNAGYYDGVMRDAKPATSADESLEELFSDRDFNAQIGSFYKVRVNETLDGSDALWLNGYTTGAQDDQATFYRATVLYDYFAEKAMDKDIIFRMSGSVKMQESGSPPYTSGDEAALLLFRDSEVSDFNRAFKCYAFVYDVENIDGGEYLLARGQRVPELEDSLTDYMTDETASIVTSSTYNPAVYHGAYDPEELAQKLKEIVDGAEKTPLENLSEGRFGPGVLGFGGSFKEEPAEVAALEYVSEPIYERQIPIDTIPGSGTPINFENVLNDLSGQFSGIAYEITNVYTREEAENLHENFDLPDERTLYRAHAFYDVLNDRPLDYYFDIAGWGSAKMQEDGYPPRAIGDRMLSFFNDNDREVKVPNSNFEFMLFEIGGVKIAYHICKSRIRFESAAYPNLDLEMAESEKEIVTTTSNNPIRFTQKSTLRSISDFMRTELYNRGLFTPDEPADALATVTVVPEAASLGDEIYSAGSVENLDSGNPWRQLEISEGDTLPVYERVMSRNMEQNGMIENVDRGFMREALRFYAIGFGFDPDKIVIEDNSLTPQELEKISESARTELPEEYAEPTEMSFKEGGVEVDICVTDGMFYRVDIGIEKGFELPEGAKVGFYFGASREEAENAEAALLAEYEWLIGNNDAGKTAVNSGQSENCFVTMYHPCVGEFIPYDDGTLPETDRNDIIKTIINFSLNNIDFMDDGTIYCYGIPNAFETQYRKVGDYPMITPEEALELLRSGSYVWTAFEDSGRGADDVEYTELIYGRDGVPYYKFYCSAEGWRGCEAGDYGVFYVPAIAPEYVDMPE